MPQTVSPKTQEKQKFLLTSRSPLSTPLNISLIAVFAAIIAAASLAPAIPTGGVGVPITLQTLAVFLTALILGGLRGSLAVLLYLVVGFIGLPVFAKFNSGIGVLSGASAGYLLAFPIAALIAGTLATVILRRGKFNFILLFLAAMAGSFIAIHPMGIGGMMLNADLSFTDAFKTDMTFWIGDVIKNLLATTIAIAVLKAFPQLAARKF